MLIHLKNNPNFMETIINEMTVPTTEMFRNPTLWVSLTELLMDNYNPLHTINVLHSPCSTGEELYSMSILLDEYGFKYRSLTGVDINTSSLDKAKEGKYREHLIGDKYERNYNESMIQKKNEFQHFFTQRRGNYIVKDKYRHKVYFYDHDNIEQYKIQEYDIIFCRNLLIYFEDDLQTKFLNNLTKHLKPGGLLILGAYETIRDAELSKQFETCNSHSKIYRKKK
jgi:chemotaxis protein methyltransferase CheR